MLTALLSQEIDDRVLVDPCNYGIGPLYSKSQKRKKSETYTVELLYCEYVIPVIVIYLSYFCYSQKESRLRSSSSFYESSSLRDLSNNLI